MTLRTRLVLGLAAVALLLAVPLGVALKALTEAEQAAGNLRAQEVAASLLLGRIRTTTQNLRDAEKAVLFVTDSADSPAWMQREMHALRGYADSLAPLALEPLALQIRRSSVVLDRYGPLEWAAVAKGASDAADDLSERHIVPAIEAVERMLTDSEEALVGRAEHRANAAAQAASDARSLAGCCWPPRWPARSSWPTGSPGRSAGRCATSSAGWPRWPAGSSATSSPSAPSARTSSGAWRRATAAWPSSSRSSTSSRPNSSRSPRTSSRRRST
jgi:hypothetical protein